MRRGTERMELIPERFKLTTRNASAWEYMGRSGHSLNKPELCLHVVKKIAILKRLWNSTSVFIYLQGL